MSENYAFDSNGVEPSKPREALPLDWYRMWIVASQLKSTKNGDGTILELELIVLDGPYENRHVWVNLNIQNPSPRAQEIAQRDLSAICHATGVLKFRTPSELHHKPLMVRAGPARQAGYEDKTEARGFKPDESGRPTPAVRPSTSAPRASAPSRQPQSAARSRDDDSDLPF